MIGQWHVGVGRLGLVVLADLLQALAAGVSIDGGPLDEIEQARPLTLPSPSRGEGAPLSSGPFHERALLLLLQRAAAGGRPQLEIIQRSNAGDARRSAGQGEGRGLIGARDVKRR